VQSDEKCYLVLGCFGREDDGFVSCRGIENRILKIDTSLVYFEEVMDYFDSVRLFDRHMLDSNAIRHLIYNLQDRFDQKVRRLWNENRYNLLERFLHNHKQCGLYAKLILVPASEDRPRPKEPETVMVRGTPEPERREKKPVLKLLRGRR
jgi:hypothetical protein